MAFPTGWTRKCKITIPDAQISGSNTDFPVLITQDNLPTEMLDGGANSALDGGGDVRFSEDSTGATRLDLDVVSFVTGGAPDVQLWTKLPTCNTGAAKEFYVWYKKAGENQPGATDLYGSDAVWSAAELSVLMEDATPIDHAGNHSLAITGGLTNIDGPFGKANAFAGTGRLSNSDAVLRDIFATYDTTVSVISRKSAFAPNRAVLSWSGADDIGLYPMEDDGSPTEGVRGFWRDVTNNSTFRADNVAVANVWGWMSMSSRASDDHQLHQNGVLVATDSDTGAAGPFTAFYIGGFGASSQDFDGDIAQVIVWKTARSSDWIATEYNNQSAPASFANAGTPEAVGGGGLALVMQNTVHTIVSDNMVLAQSHNLSLTAVNHSITSENTVLSLGQAITIQDAGHGLTSDVTTLSQIQVQNPASSFHTMTNDNVILFQGFGLAIGDVRQGLVSDDVTFVQLQALLIQNATHGLGSGQVAVIDPTAFTPSPGRTLKVTGKSRILTPNAGDRTTQPINT